MLRSLDTKRLQQRWRFQLFGGNGNLLVASFCVERRFQPSEGVVVDRNEDGDKEIGIGGVELPPTGVPYDKVVAHSPHRISRRINELYADERSNIRG